MTTISDLYAEMKSLGLTPTTKSRAPETKVNEPKITSDTDIYDVLLGAAPTLKENQTAISRALRRKRDFGELGMLTGDKVLANLGQNLASNADASVAALQGTRQKDIDNAQTKSYQDAQISHMDDTAQETKRNNTLDFLVQSMMADAARTRANRPPGGRPVRLRASDIKALQSNAKAMSSINSASDFLDKGGSLGAVKVGGLPIPMLRESLNSLANHGIGTDANKASALQWQEYQRFYELAERNALFGATLTPHEMAAWRSANPNSAQTDAQIKAGLGIMAKVYQHQQKSLSGGLATEGYNADAIDQYGNVQTPDDSGDDTGPLEFATEAEAEAAGLPEGTPVIVGGVPGKWHNN